MSVGNDIGFTFAPTFTPDGLFLKNYGGILIEATEELENMPLWLIGMTTDKPEIDAFGEIIPLSDLKQSLEGTLESVFPTRADASGDKLVKPVYTERNTKAPAVKTARPAAVIPVFPGTNCEYVTSRTAPVSSSLRSCVHRQSRTQCMTCSTTVTV